jgi:hypothetical protein
LLATKLAIMSATKLMQLQAQLEPLRPSSGAAGHGQIRMVTFRSEHLQHLPHFSHLQQDSCSHLQQHPSSPQSSQAHFEPSHLQLFLTLHDELSLQQHPSSPQSSQPHVEPSHLQLFLTLHDGLSLQGQASGLQLETHGTDPSQQHLRPLRTQPVLASPQLVEQPDPEHPPQLVEQPDPEHPPQLPTG